MTRTSVTSLVGPSGAGASGRNRAATAVPGGRLRKQTRRKPAAKGRRKGAASRKRRWSAARAWLGRHRLGFAFSLALLLLAGGTVSVLMFVPGVYQQSGLVALFGPRSADTITGSAEADKTVLGCVRGATASALSAAVPAGPLAATGVLVPGSAALVATASAIGCGVGAATTTTTSGFEYLLKQGRQWVAGWFGF